MAVGRVICVALPFILTVCSLITLLIAGLAGVTNKDLYLFQVNTTDLSISEANLKNLINVRDIDVKGILDNVSDDVKNEANKLLNSVPNDVKNEANKLLGGSGNNITAADLGLANLYNVNLWGYCTVDAEGKKECTKAKFDWASGSLNTSFIETVGSLTGKKIDIPDEIENALNAFKAVSKWTQVSFIIAVIALGVQVIFGFFTSCSRIVSCLTYIVSGISSLAVIAAASLSTAMAVVVVGAVESTAKFYGVEGGFNRTFLGLVWASVAFALAAGFFWLFTICCCAPDKRNRHSKRGSSDAEKLLPSKGTAYQPIHEPQMSGSAAGYYNNAAQYGAPRHSAAPRGDMAYEPYSHRG